MKGAEKASDKMIKLGRKFQEIFTRPEDFLPHSVRWSETFCED